MEKLNPSSGGFESKEAPNHLMGKNSTATFSTGPEPGAGEVGNNAPNPYGGYEKK